MKKSLKTFFKFISIFSFVSLFPMSALAAGTCDALTGISKIICLTQQILNSIIPVLMALGVVYFVWGVVQFMIADAEEAKTKGKDKIIYGLIGFAAIIGLWGLVNILVTTFGIGGVVAPKLDTVASSATCTMGTDLKGVLNYAACIINSSVIPLIFAVAVVMFIWGAVNFFIINSDEEAKRAQGKQFMIWGIIALTVMLSVWGLVGILGSTFGIRGNILPQVTPPGSSQNGSGGGGGGQCGGTTCDSGKSCTGTGTSTDPFTCSTID